MALTSSVPLPQRAAAVASVVNDYLGHKPLVPLGVFLAIAENESQFREDVSPRPTKKNPNPSARGPWQLLKPIAAYLKIHPVSHRSLLEVSTPVIVKELNRAARLVKKAAPGIDPDNFAALVYFAHSEGPGALKRGLLTVLRNHLPVNIENVVSAVGRVNVGEGLSKIKERWRFWQSQKKDLLAKGDEARLLAAGPREAAILDIGSGGMAGLDAANNRYEMAVARRWALGGLEGSRWFRRWGTSTRVGRTVRLARKAHPHLVQGPRSCHPYRTTISLSGHESIAVQNDVLGLGSLEHMTTHPNPYGHPIVGRPIAYERWRGAPAFLRGGAFGTCYRGQGCAPMRADLDKYGIRGGGGGFLERDPRRPAPTTMKPWGSGSEAIVERQLADFGLIEPTVDHMDDSKSAAAVYWKTTDDWSTGKPAIPHEGADEIVKLSDGSIMPIILDAHGNPWVRRLAPPRAYLPARPDLLDREKLTKSKI